MNSSKFLSQLSRTYKNILFEQDLAAPPVPAGPDMGSAAGAVPPMPPAPPMGTPADSVSSVEKDKTGQAEPLQQEGQTNLAGMLAKAFFIELVDNTERYQIENLQNSLQDESKVSEVEFELVKKLESLDTQIIDVDKELFELTPDGAKLFIDEVIKRKLIPGLEIKPGGGKAYMINLIITTLLRPTDLNVVDISNLLEEIKEKTENIKESRFEPLYNAAFNKYAKV